MLLTLFRTIQPTLPSPPTAVSFPPSTRVVSSYNFRCITRFKIQKSPKMAKVDHSIDSYELNSSCVVFDSWCVKYDAARIILSNFNDFWAILSDFLSDFEGFWVSKSLVLLFSSSVGLVLLNGPSVVHVVHVNTTNTVQPLTLQCSINRAPLGGYPSWQLVGRKYEEPCSRVGPTSA